MKHTKQITLCLLAAMVLTAGCTGNFMDMNRNWDEVVKDERDRDNYDVNANLRGLQSYVIPTQEHLYQFYEALAGGSFAGYFEATEPGWKNKFSTYNPPSDWLSAPFKESMTKTYSYYRSILENEPDDVVLALSSLFRIAIMHRLTDTYGPIPYSKVLDDKTESLRVPYDSQEELYELWFEELDGIREVLMQNTNLSPKALENADDVYAGNISKWIKFTNSLQLRMAMRLVYVDEQLARTKAAEAVGAGVIEDNADNAKMWVEMNYTEMMFNDWADHRMGADIVNFMNSYKDPRRARMFTRTGTGDDDYHGIRIGIDPESKSEMVNNYSNILITKQDPLLWMNAAEVTFLRAEGALRGWSAEMGGEARELYEKAIALSFEERGANGAEDYIINEDPVVSYVDPLEEYSWTGPPPTTINVKWNDDQSDAGYFEGNLERIITQKWIAIFPNGIEAWAEYRRTGYPALMEVVENKSGNVIDSKLMIRRLPYPAEEYRENTANLQEAIDMLGGTDNGGVRLWWDRNPRIN